MTNYELAAKIKEKILAEPEHFNMFDFYDLDTKASRMVTCDTTCCIAGWGHIILCSIPSDKGTEVPMMNYLGLENSHLFYCSEWPEDLQNGFDYLTKSEKAERACQAIDYYMKGIPEFEITSNMILAHSGIK